MNAQAPMNRDSKKGEAIPFLPRPPRMRAQLRQALNLIVTEGRTQREAAARSGIHEKSLSRAIARPDVAAYLEAQKAIFALEAHKLKASAQSIAIVTGIHLMQEAKSEAVRARMVELFAGEGVRGTQVNVQVNNAPSSYAYEKPGEIVDVQALTTDSMSGGEDSLSD